MSRSKLYFKDMNILNPSRFKRIITDVMFQIAGDIIADGGGFTNTGATLVWTIDDGGVITQFTQNPIPAYTLVNSFADVTVSSADNFVFVTGMDFRNQNILGEFNISVLTEIQGVVFISSNGDLSSIVTPLNNKLITQFKVELNNLTGVLNLSSLLNFNGQFTCDRNPLLSGIVLNNNAILTLLSAYLTGLSGILDISNIIGISGAISVHSCPNLTNINFPQSNGIVTSILLYSNNITGIFDLSMFTNGISGNVYLYSNPNLTEILFANNVSTIPRLWSYSSNLTGILDLSMLIGGINSIRLNSNSALTSVIMPTTSTNISQIDIFSCNLTGTLDISGLTGLQYTLGVGVIVYSNPNLTNIIFPSCSGTVYRVYAYSCALGYIDMSVMPNLIKTNNGTYRFENNSMVAGEVNHILYDLSVMALTEGVGGDFTGRTINISGTNAAPDSSSGGFNGTQAVIDLQSKGITVTTS